jgi:hypothetical protein
MNAPRVCKLRKICLTVIDQCALRNGVKTPQFHQFQMFLQCTVNSVHIELPLIDLAFLKFASGSGMTRKAVINHSGSTTLNNDKKKTILFKRKKKYFTKAVFAGIP